MKRLGKSLEIGQNASESVPLFHEYTTYKLRSPSWVFDLPQGYRTVPRKSWISELFRPHLEISTEPFLMGLEVSFLGVIFASWSGILFYYYYYFFCLRVSDPRICHFFFHGYSLSKRASRFRQKKQDKASYWWTCASFQFRFR